MNEITIRTANEKDIDFLATMVLKNSRNNNKIGMFDLLFASKKETDLVENIKKLITIDKKIYCYYKNFLIASLNKTDSAVLCNYEPRLTTSTYVEDALQQLDIVKEDYKYVSMLSYCEIDTDKKVWMLDFLTQKEGTDSLDIAKALIQKSLLQASLKGYRIVRTIISAKKADVILMYHKLGFDTLLQKECSLFQDQLGENRAIVLEYHL